MYRRGIKEPSPLSSIPIRGRATGSVRARVEEVGQRPRVTFRIDRSRREGALSPEDGETIAAAARTARDKQIPLVGIIASSGADIEAGLPALCGWGAAARELVRCSGVVPMVFVVDGPAVSGPALLIGLSDIVVMTSQSYAFVQGPHMVRQFTGQMVTKEALGGPPVHLRTSGVAHVVADDLDDAIAVVDEILAYLPSSAFELPSRWPGGDPPDRSTPDAYAILPEAPTGSYDVRDLIGQIVDFGHLVELRAGWAANLVTGLATIDGRPVGVVANQPQTVAGTLDIAASQKGGRFVAMCDAFNVPLLTLVDTSGFYPGKDLEWRGMIRYGAQMAFAYARATVPRVCLTIRKSYGGAYIVMDSKHMGNDLSFAWPSAEIAVMGAKGAVEILHRRADAETRARLEREYEERLLNPYIAAERGSIDEVIDPADTRRRIADAFYVLSSKREGLPRRAHDNTPL